MFQWSELDNDWVMYIEQVFMEIWVMYTEQVFMEMVKSHDVPYSTGITADSGVEN